MTGRHVNAAESAKQGQVCVSDTEEVPGDNIADMPGEVPGDNTCYSRHQDNKTSKQQETATHPSESATAAPMISPESEKQDDRPPVDGKPMASLMTFREMIKPEY